MTEGYRVLSGGGQTSSWEEQCAGGGYRSQDSLRGLQSCVPALRQRWHSVPSTLTRKQRRRKALIRAGCDIKEGCLSVFQSGCASMRWFWRQGRAVGRIVPRWWGSELGCGL